MRLLPRLELNSTRGACLVMVRKTITGTIKKNRKKNKEMKAKGQRFLLWAYVFVQEMRFHHVSGLGVPACGRANVASLNWNF